MADKPIIGGYNHKNILVAIKQKEKEQADILFSIIQDLARKRTNELTGEQVKLLGVALGLATNIIEKANAGIELITNVDFTEKKMQYRSQRASGE